MLKFEEFIFLLNPDEPLFIVGDLNMDLKSNKGGELKEFLVDNNLKNFVNDYTRIARTFYKDKKEYIESKTLIDVILHNNDNVKNTSVLCVHLMIIIL